MVADGGCDGFDGDSGGLKTPHVPSLHLGDLVHDPHLISNWEAPLSSLL